MKNEVTFLLGAGAETKKYGLPSGEDFKKNIILNTKHNEIFNLFNVKNDILLDNQKILKYNATSTLYQTIIENKDEYEKIKNEFDNNDTIIIDYYLKYKMSKNSDRNGNSEDFQKLYKEKIYDQIIENKENDYCELLKFYLKNLSFCSYIDSYFNYLRKVNLYRRESSRVIKVYYSAFQIIVNEIGTFKEKISKIKDLDVITRRKMFFEFLDNEINELINYANNYDDNYYLLIKDFKNKYNLKMNIHNINYINIITTNYTSICQKVVDIIDEKIAYVHGKLKLFENIKTKEIKEIDEFQEDDVIMPYIMIPSGIKPIISPYQIKEWYKAISFIDNSKYLIILGYGINSDDEHITSIIRNSINQIVIIFFLYNKEEDEKKYKDSKNKILEIFGCSDKFYFFKSKEFKKILDEIANDQVLNSSI